jgi:uncharacterized protein HemX
MLEPMEKMKRKKSIKLYGALLFGCLILAAGINYFMDQESQNTKESETLRSLKSELEQYRQGHGDKGDVEDLVKIWKSYEGKLSSREIEKLKQDYSAKLDPAEVEGLKKAYKDMKGRNP